MAIQSGQFHWEGRAWLERTKQAARDGTQLALEHVLAEATKLVPLDEGTLMRSGRVLMAPEGAQGAVTYDTPYAVIQHENLEYKHLPGRQAKYLEQPLLTEKDTMLAIVAAKIRSDAFAGGRLG